MSERAGKDYYMLKDEVRYEVLSNLNATRLEDFDLTGRLQRAFCRAYIPESVEQAQDWVRAIYSGKKIVNPMSPREELEQYLVDRQEEAKYPSGDDVRIRIIGIKQGVKKAIEIIAKEHPDVADWIKDVNEHG
ncbi:hypothetical protein [Sporolactobacillus terrae]|uniref:hypothetical protein n=1 Tax=Sporolactobacillus terrae TaxID=269673 RepID=UPI00048DCC5E|nr:hypothetical protein [Sporolactobacillus terrae]